MYQIPKIMLLAAFLNIVVDAAPCPSQQRPNAIYFLTNDEANAIVALPIADDGMLSDGTVTPTGGAGANSIDGTSYEPAIPDPLIGQSALTVAGQYIFAVNTGSDTLSMLEINPTDPTQLTMIGEPVAVQGEFPNTVAASTKHKLACVGTTGAQNGVSCATFSSRGLGQMDDLRSFDIQQSTPPVGPTNSVSQVFFSEDESMLYSTIKGDPAANNTGFFSVFNVEERSGKPSRLSTTDVRSSPEGTAVLFGSANIPGTSSVFVTDASFGGAVLSIDPTSNEASLVAMQVIENQAAMQVIENQAATCWATISEMTGSAFVTDVAVNHVVEMSVTDAQILSIVDLSSENQDPGLIDLKAAGTAVYALSPGNGTTTAAVSVLDVRGGQGSATLLQRFDLESMGVGPNAQGMAVLRK